MRVREPFYEQPAGSSGGAGVTTPWRDPRARHDVACAASAAYFAGCRSNRICARASTSLSSTGAWKTFFIFTTSAFQVASGR